MYELSGAVARAAAAQEAAGEGGGGDEGVPGAARRGAREGGERDPAAQGSYTCTLWSRRVLEHTERES